MLSFNTNKYHKIDGEIIKNIKLLNLRKEVRSKSTKKNHLFKHILKIKPLYMIPN